MNIKYQVLSVAALSFLLFTGCESAPEKQIEEAFAALATADSLEADLYAPELYTAAQDSFAAAQSEVEGQEGVAGVKPDYARAKALLAYTTETANLAASEVPARKEAMRLETDGLIADAQARLAAAQELIAASPAQNNSVTFVNLQSNSHTAQSSLQQAVEAQAAGDFALANELVKKAIAALDVLETEAQASGLEATSPRS